MFPWSQDEYLRAYHFAARAHRWQLYPGTSIPYIMHLSFVSMEVMSMAQPGSQPPINFDLALQCALLHDVLEDTRVRYEQVRDEFGEDVAQGVLALTLNKQLPKAEQMPECLQRIKLQPREVWMVKLADRITNLQPPPRHWSKARIRDYHRESLVIYEALKDASSLLADRLRLKIDQYAAFGK
jgi:guanosine-3',5'-bis(diphosphate) 3'-pyrophosphohydrolase